MIEAAGKREAKVRTAKNREAKKRTAGIRSAENLRDLALNLIARSNERMKTRRFRDLLVWQRSMRLVEAVYIVTKQFPKEELFGLAGQMRRAAVSVPSNIAEGQGRGSDKTFALFLNQARGSLYELETQTELARNLGMIPTQHAEQLLAEAEEINRMLLSLRNTLRNPQSKPQP